MTARIIEVIEVFEPRGKGTEDNPMRNVRQLYEKNGKLIFEDDVFDAKDGLK